MPQDNLKEKTAKGFFWGMLNNGTTQVLNLLFGIFLGRLLSPEDFGVTGVLVIFTTLAGNLQSAGFPNALVNLKQATQRDFNAVFWFNVLVGLLCYMVLFFAAPLIAGFFHDPRLVLVSRVTFLSFVISSLGIAHSAYLFKHLMVRETTIAGFVALLTSGFVGIGMAFAHCAYWSIVGQQLTYISVLNLMRLRYSRFRPSWHIDLRPIKPMLGFAVKILIPNVINTLSQNLLTFVFGRLYPMRAVGLFNQANNWNNKAYSFTSGMLNQVSQPVLASVSDDVERERRVFRKMTRFTAFVSFPLMFGLAMVAKELIVCTVSAKWLESVPLLQLLCIGGAFMPFYSLYQGLVMGRGRSDIYMWCNIGQIVLQLLLLVALHQFGITWMVAATSAFTILYLLVWQVQIKRQIDVGFMDAIKDVLPFAFLSILVMGIVWTVTQPLTLPDWLMLLLRMALGGAGYVGLMKLLRVKMLDECFDFVRQRLGRHATGPQFTSKTNQ